MNKWHIGKIVRLEKQKNNEYLSFYYDGDKTGHHSHCVEITILRDKALSINQKDGEGYIYLYPEQVKHLKKILCGR